MACGRQAGFDCVAQRLCSIGVTGSNAAKERWDWELRQCKAEAVERWANVHAQSKLRQRWALVVMQPTFFFFLPRLLITYYSYQ